MPDSPIPETEPLSDDEQARFRAARKAGFTESAALDLIVKLRETKDRDATIASLKAALEEAEQTRDLYRTSLIEHQATLAAVERERDALRRGLGSTMAHYAKTISGANPWKRAIGEVAGYLSSTDREASAVVAALNGEGT